MSETADLIAVDLGAESGRTFLGSFDGDRVGLEEVRRFPNLPVRIGGSLHWDVLRIMQEVKDGLAAAVEEGGRPASIGVDSWGVDFALLDRDGALVSNPHHYRDSRTEGLVEVAAGRVSESEIYRVTGIQFMQINTLYQLLAMEGSPLLGAADTLLLIPDLIAYWLTGGRACEYTNATTTQLYDLGTAGWASDLMGDLGIPERLFPEIVAPGVRLGSLLPEVREETGLGEVPVTAVATHDTASAVVAVPADGPFAYISSGTWSLVGVEAEEPVTTQAALRHNFTNEGGFGGRIRLLRNVMGLWLLQECKRTWARGGKDLSYDELVRLAEAQAPFGALVDPDHVGFLAPGDMPSRLRRFCAQTGQDLSEEPGAVARCVFESLALKYRWVLEKVEEVSGQRAEKVHVVGGGARNALLCQLTAEATRRPVLAGPVEATALGNVMVQAYGRGYVGSLQDIRAVIRSSVEVRTHVPEDDAGEWEEAYERFSGLVDTRLEDAVSE